LVTSRHYAAAGEDDDDDDDDDDDVGDELGCKCVIYVINYA